MIQKAMLTFIPPNNASTILMHFNIEPNTFKRQGQNSFLPFVSYVILLNLYYPASGVFDFTKLDAGYGVVQLLA